MIIQNKLTKPPSLLSNLSNRQPTFIQCSHSNPHLVIHKCSAFVRNRITMWVDVGN